MSDKDLPAFPIADPFAVKCPSTTSDALQLQRGMTLRDYFAAKAMQSYWIDVSITATKKQSAVWAYAMADAMLEARKS